MTHRGFLSGLASLAFLAIPLGCISSSTGALGEECTSTNPRLGSLECDSGLVCNTGRAPPICEMPNAQPAGEPCGSDVNCWAGLWCDVAVSFVCMQPLPLGAVCFPPSSCGQRRYCLREQGTARCVLAGLAGEPCAGGTVCALGLTCESASSDGVPRCFESGEDAGAGG